jgi:hypothetical protein
VSDLIAQGAPSFDAAVPILSQLLKAARFPAYKDLAGFGCASSEVNEALVRQLHRGEFIDGADNVVQIGGPGTGKTHIATALAFVSSYRTLCEAPDDDFLARLEEIRRDEFAWLAAFRSRSAVRSEADGGTNCQ